MPETEIFKSSNDSWSKQYGSLDGLTQGIASRYDDAAWDLFSVALA